MPSTWALGPASSPFREGGDWEESQDPRADLPPSLFLTLRQGPSKSLVTQGRLGSNLGSSCLCLQEGWIVGTQSGLSPLANTGISVGSDSGLSQPGGALLKPTLLSLA